jgi:hypothetical protein
MHVYSKNRCSTALDLSLKNIQTSKRITRTSRFCVLLLHVWYLIYYIFQETQCICHFINPIRKTDADNKLCLREAQVNYSWVYKGRIPLNKVKVRLFVQIRPKIYRSNCFKHKFYSQNMSSNILMCPSNI